MGTHERRNGPRRGEKRRVCGHPEQGSVCRFRTEPRGEAGPRGEGWAAPLQGLGPGLFGRQPHPPKEFCVPSKLLRNWQGHHTYQNDTD